MKIGYARASTDEQTIRAQVVQLKKAGCERIFTDEGVSGKAVIKDGLREAIAFAREGDQLVVVALDRMCRNLKQLLEEIDGLADLGIEFCSLREKIDTSSPAGRFFFHIVGALAEFERDLIVERTKAGLAAAKERGAKLGRPSALSDEQWTEAQALLQTEPPVPVARVAKLLGAARQTNYKRIKQERSKAAQVEG
ncbi:MAG: recombinase family protein [Erythrobacter sp.]